ncbi:hypothetical protein R84B8_01151 [Treponema sp. R8-4-B8]
MYKPYMKPVETAFPDVKIPPPKVSKLFIFIVSILSKPYLFMLFGMAKILLRGEAFVFDAFKRALSKKSRCIIAFRHPDGREPQLLAWFFLFRLKALAAKNKIRFELDPHAIFVYGYEVVRWGGALARIFMPNLGAIPIHHTKIDSKGMARIYNAIIDGQYPIALAPEGQVSYSMDSLPRLEHGSIRIGFQAASQMASKNMDCPLEILPLSIHYRYGRGGKAAMEKLLKKIEKFCGFSKRETASLSFTERLRECREYILQINESRYHIKSDGSAFEQRLERVVNAALETSERFLGLKSEGDFFQRLYKVRHDCWDRIFLPGSDNLKKVPLVKRSVMDLGAGEAWHISRHQELADFGWYFRHPLPTEETALHQKIEFVQNLWDFANRTMGGALSGRVNIPVKKVIIKGAPVINLSGRLNQYKEDKRAAVTEATSDLEKAFLKCIEEMKGEE